MACATRWHDFGGCGDRDALPLLLLVSLLLHLSLIALPLAGRSVGGRDSANGLRPSSLHVSLNDPALPRRVAEPTSKPAPEPASKLAPEPTPAPRAPVLAADDAAPQRQAGLAFYPSAALTVRPVALSEPQLEDGDAVSGELVLWIDDRGAVVEVSAGRGDPPSARLHAVADAFRRVRFAPGELNGKKVGSVMRIEVSYDDERLPIEP